MEYDEVEAKMNAATTGFPFNPVQKLNSVIEEWRQILSCRIEETAKIQRLIILLERNPDSHEIREIEKSLGRY